MLACQVATVLDSWSNRGEVSMIVRPGKILAAAEVLALPIWKALLEQFKRFGLTDRGGAPGLYDLIREQANGEKSRSKKGCVSRLSSSFKREKVGRTRWNQGLEVFSLSRVFDWRDAGNRPCFPSMEFERDGDHVTGAYLQWKIATQVAISSRSPEDDAAIREANLTAAIVFHTGNRSMRDVLFPKIAVSCDDASRTLVTSLGAELIGITYRYTDDNVAERRDLLERAARFALDMIALGKGELHAALVLDQEEHVGNSTEFGLSCDLERAIKLCTSEFHESFHPKSVVKGALLIDRSTYGELQHEFHCEPLDDFDNSGPAYRVWSSARPPFITDELIQQAEVILNETAANGYRLVVPTSSPRESAFWAYAMRRWVSRFWPHGKTFACTCSPTRTFDLLGPLAETLRELINLNRLISPNAESHHLKEVIEDWITRLVGEDPTRSSYESVLTALLLGGQLKSREYGEVADYVATILEKVASQSEDSLSLVLPDVHSADSATRRLLECLASQDKVALLTTCDERYLPEFDDRWIRIEGDNRLKSISAQLRNESLSYHDSLSEDEILLVRTALVAGPDPLRGWLRNLWCEIKGRSESSSVEGANRDVLRAQFEVTCSKLLSLGLLRISGRLADIENRTMTYREVNFATRWHMEQALKHWPPSEEFKHDVKRTFATVFREHHCRAASVPLRFVRRKLLVCHFLKGLSVQDLPDKLLSVVVQLWLIVANRAKSAGFIAEAAERIREARKLLDDGRASGRIECDTRLRAEVATFCLTLPGGEFAHDSRLLTEAEELKSHVDGLWSKEQEATTAFAFYRSLWSNRNTWGPSLIAAKNLADALKERFSTSAISDSTLLRLEIEHIFTVTCFSLGHFEEATRSAEAGKAICVKLKAETGKFDDSSMFGSHCGGGCCKVLFALAVGISSANYALADQLAGEAQDYVDSIKDPASQTIVRAFRGMLRLLARRYGEALDVLEDALKLKETQSAKRWRLFAQLLLLCAAIGARCDKGEGHGVTPEHLSHILRRRLGMFASSKAENPADDLLPLIEEVIVEWSKTGDDFYPVWRTFQGLAEFLAGHPDHALVSINQAAGRAKEREERMYLPEVWRWQALVQENLGDYVGAEKTLTEARDLADELGATLYVGRAETQLERLRTKTRTGETPRSPAH